LIFPLKDKFGPSTFWFKDLDHKFDGPGQGFVTLALKGKKDG
jgi:hypothetical protein